MCRRQARGRAARWYMGDADLSRVCARKDERVLAVHAAELSGADIGGQRDVEVLVLVEHRVEHLGVALPASVSGEPTVHLTCALLGLLLALTCYSHVAPQCYLHATWHHTLPPCDVTSTLLGTIRYPHVTLTPRYLAPASHAAPPNLSILPPPTAAHHKPREKTPADVQRHGTSGCCDVTASTCTPFRDTMSGGLRADTPCSHSDVTQTNRVLTRAM